MKQHFKAHFISTDIYKNIYNVYNQIYKTAALA